MRIGQNPHKRKPELEPYKRHRIIIPIFIGNNHDYFAQSNETMKLCFRSLFATIDLNQVSVTVLNNGSVDEVDEILEPYLKSGQIDRYIRNKENRGKPDAVAAEIKATYEPFVTLADCDVLFYQGWMRRLEEVFMAHKGVGAASPFPAPNHPFYESKTTWLTGLLRLGIRTGKFVPDEAIDGFLNSVGKGPDGIPERSKQVQFKLENDSCGTLIGAGHFVIMFRTAAFHRFDYTPKLAGASNGERDIDAEPDKSGYLRLSTPKYHVYHLGNAVESWMEGAVAEVENAETVPLHSDDEFVATATEKRPLAGYIPPRVRNAAFSLVYLPARLYQHRFHKKRWRSTGKNTKRPTL